MFGGVQQIVATKVYKISVQAMYRKMYKEYKRVAYMLSARAQGNCETLMKRYWPVIIIKM